MNNMRDALVKIAEVDNVCYEPEVLDAFAQDRSYVKGFSPRCLVKLQNASQVENIIKWANETKTPLIPVSSAAPHYKGDTVPGVPEAVIVDLSGMKKILSINRKHRIAVIEPGVTYDELKLALMKEGMTVSMPLAPRAGKSVVGSLLETEPRLNALHQWCNLDPLRCMEVTWGDGNKMFTGEAGGSIMDIEAQWKEEKWQWEAAGPMMLDFYRLITGAQGTMGIVTWASIRCEIIPQVHRGYFVPAKRLEDLIDFSYNVLRLRLSEEFFIMNAAQLSRLVADSNMEAEKLEKELPPWTAVIGISGREILPEERVEFQEKDIMEIAQKHGLCMVSSVAGISGEKVLEKAANTCGEKSFKETAAGAFQDIFFATTLDRTPDFTRAMERLSGEAGYTRNIGVYLQPENMGTSYHCSFTLPYNPESRPVSIRTKELFELASAEFSQMGAYYSRPYGIWSKLQLNKDAESYSVLQQLKNIFDPKGIMNPGKLCNF